MNLWDLFLRTFHFGTPIIFAAILHGFVLKYDWFQGLKKPLDGGAKVRDKPLFGANKTWRGLFVSVVGTVIFAYVHRLLFDMSSFFHGITIVNYTVVSPLHVGLALGVGMILGELPNSLLKRQIGIGAGQQRSDFIGVLFRLYDQLDLLVGAWLLMMLVPHFSVLGHLDVVFFSIFMTLVLHILIGYIGYALGMRQTPH
ncbi:CDP-archaeol synthase [bacterium]|nr:CDP-archaeol synthase [bacterium]